jgi:hypothetical protein
MNWAIDEFIIKFVIADFHSVKITFVAETDVDGHDGNPEFLGKLRRKVGCAIGNNSYRH